MEKNKWSEVVESREERQEYNCSVSPSMWNQEDREIKYAIPTAEEIPQE
jgi:hypothetical protein